MRGDADELERAAEATHAFTVQGPQQALAMLLGLKLIENRAWRIPPGWYALHVGSQRRSEWGERAAARHPELPAEEELEDHFGAVVGLLRIAEQRRIEECNGYQWAYGPVCHVVSHGLRFATPIRQSGDRGLWPLSPRLLRLVAVQLGAASLRQHDLSALAPCPPSAGIGPTGPPRARDHGGGGELRGPQVQGVSFYGAGAASMWRSFSSAAAAETDVEVGVEAAAAKEPRQAYDVGASSPLGKRGTSGGRGRGGREVAATRTASAYNPSSAIGLEDTTPWARTERGWDHSRH